MQMGGTWSFLHLKCHTPMAGLTLLKGEGGGVHQGIEGKWGEGMGGEEEEETVVCI